jgi:predicted CXXCH cytochrome family protein
MKRIGFVLLIAFVLLLTVPKLASADAGPHGTNYTATTDACAGCHRAHSASAPKLLMQSTVALCMTCHDGSGATTNVADGILVGASAMHGLKGGGFTNAVMDTNVDGSSPSSAVTSAHSVDGTQVLAWGNGAIGTAGVGANMGLTCGSCHDPHGKAGTQGAPTYRLLRPLPLDSNASTGVEIADETTKTYTVASSTNDYFGESYGTMFQQMSNWCSECHTRYAAGDNGGHTASGDSNFMFRHPSTTSEVGCMSCHVAHGTSASMGANSGAVAWPGGVTTPNGNARSSLLRVDNRGVCQRCHNK